MLFSSRSMTLKESELKGDEGNHYWCLQCAIANLFKHVAATTPIGKSPACTGAAPTGTASNGCVTRLDLISPLFFCASSHTNLAPPPSTTWTLNVDIWIFMHPKYLKEVEELPAFLKHPGVYVLPINEAVGGVTTPAE